MLVYVAANGMKAAEYVEKSYVKKIEPSELFGHQWSAIQLSTASSVCAVLDLVLQNPSRYQGFILQENFLLPEFLNNRFGTIFSDN
jgi:saccharopine dehydrogenase-like NADP-dependent oxidoreductase